MSYLTTSFLVALAFLASVQGQGGRYRDPCRGKSCGDNGCCVRKNFYYGPRHRILHRGYECACDDGYYWDRKADVCREGCYSNDCHQYATCYAKIYGSNDYPGFNTYNQYVDSHYYCQCNDGYVGNGRQCRPRDPCHDHDCSEYATCHPKRYGATDYYNHATYKGYVNSYYFCRCRDNYYGNGKQCTHSCHDNDCGSYATCVPKRYGASNYHGSGSCPQYRNRHYYCRCHEGYGGCGRTCRPLDPCHDHDCSEYATCHPKEYGATDYYNYATYRGYVNSRYYCRCRNNYYGNGKQCTPSCHDNDCGSYATCVPKRYGASNYHGSGSCPQYRNRHYYCRCHEGYGGCGRTCRPLDPCHGVDCGRYASCVAKSVGIRYPSYPHCLKYVPYQYYCQCNRGYVGSACNPGDCRPQDPCDGHQCHQYATCHPKRRGGRYDSVYDDYDYYCQCRDNYSGNGKNCYRCRCHAHASCIAKRCGSTDYPGYHNNRSYARLCYYCQCNDNYYGDGQQCLRRLSNPHGGY